MEVVGFVLPTVRAMQEQTDGGNVMWPSNFLSYSMQAEKPEVKYTVSQKSQHDRGGNAEAH